MWLILPLEYQTFELHSTKILKLIKLIVLSSWKSLLKTATLLHCRFLKSVTKNFTTSTFLVMEFIASGVIGLEFKPVWQNQVNDLQQILSAQISYFKVVSDALWVSA